MKKSITTLLLGIGALSLVFCGKENTYELKIVIPAGSMEEYVYSDMEISPTGNKITISAGEGLSDTEVILEPVEVREENAYEPTYLTPGMPVKIEVEKGAWFKVGILGQNSSIKDIEETVIVKGVKVRTPD